MDDYKGNSNKYLFDANNNHNSKNDKSTSATSSLTNTPPLNALRVSADKNDE
jgi:hypothetical protein